MLSLYKRERIKSVELKIGHIHKSIPYSSVLFLTQDPNFEESFFNRLGNERWKCIITEMFTACIINLLISGKITVVYFEDRKSILFKLIHFKKVGYNLFPAENLEDGNDDLLANYILSILQKSDLNEMGNFSAIIKKVFNLYIGANENFPAKKFFIKYLANYAKENSWLKLKANDKFLGLIKNYNYEIAIDMQMLLLESNKELCAIKFQLRKTNLLFRDFLAYIDQIIDEDIEARYSNA